MKSVLISIRPEWCDKITSSEKTIEIRKCKPKLEPPFKCYIYCTKQKEMIVCNGISYYNDELYRLPNGEIKYGCSIELAGYNSDDYSNNNFLNGKVIGEFICDRIEEFESEFYSSDNVLNAIYRVVEDEDYPGERIYTSIATNEEDSENFWICSLSCLSFEEIKKYIGYDKPEKTFYGWHISDLVIYDKPKEVREFRKNCPNKAEYCSHCGWKRTCDNQCANPELLISRPPQSWCYVEEVSE